MSTVYFFVILLIFLSFKFQNNKYYLIFPSHKRHRHRYKTDSDERFMMFAATTFHKLTWKNSFKNLIIVILIFSP
jgi:hypothetical protein